MFTVLVYFLFKRVYGYCRFKKKLQIVKRIYCNGNHFTQQHISGHCQKQYHAYIQGLEVSNAVEVVTVLRTCRSLDI